MSKMIVQQLELQCPYCEAKIPDAEEALRPAALFYEKSTAECPQCSKKFLAYASYSYTSKQDCEVNGDTHDIQPDPAMPPGALTRDFFECTKCAHWFSAERVEPAPKEGESHGT